MTIGEPVERRCPNGSVCECTGECFNPVIAPQHPYWSIHPQYFPRFEGKYEYRTITMPNDWLTFGKKPTTKEELEMSKEEIEKQIAELQGKLDEIETGPKFEIKPAFNGDLYGDGSSDHVFVSPKKYYVELALESFKGKTVCVWLNGPETQELIQALQKCVDWLEGKR